MSLDVAGTRADRAFTGTTWGRALIKATHFALALLGLAIVIQAFIVVQARPQDLVTGVYSMADLIRRAMPPNFSELPSTICRRCRPSTSLCSGHWRGSLSRFRWRSLPPPI